MPSDLTKMQNMKWTRDRASQGTLPSEARVHSSGTALELVGALFDIIDLDGGGDLDEEETKQYLKAMGVAESDLDTRWRTMLATADTDGDGAIDRSEFLTYILKDEELTEDGAFVNADREAELTEVIIMLQMTRLYHIGPAADLVGALFDAIDADGGGDLDEEETKGFLKVLGVADSDLDTRWRTMLATADTDGDGMIDRSEFLTYILKDEELTEDGAFVNADREAELTDAIIQLQFGDETAGGVIDLDVAADKETPSSILHVRGVGGAFESEEALVEVFDPFGTVVQATVRHRIDAEGNNTSWALVTMSHYKGAHRAIKRAAELPKPLTVTRFSKQQADASKGAMGSIRKEAAAKQIQCFWRQRRAWFEASTTTMLEQHGEQSRCAETADVQSPSVSSPVRKPWKPVRIVVSRPEVESAQQEQETVGSPVNAALRLEVEQHEARAAAADGLLSELLSPPGSTPRRPMRTHHSPTLSLTPRASWQGHSVVAEQVARAERANVRLDKARAAVQEERAARARLRPSARFSVPGCDEPPRPPDVIAHNTNDKDGGQTVDGIAASLHRPLAQSEGSPRHPLLRSPAELQPCDELPAKIFPLSPWKEPGTKKAHFVRSTSVPVNVAGSARVRAEGFIQGTKPVRTASTGTSSGSTIKHGVQVAGVQCLHSRPPTAAALAYVKLTHQPTAQRPVFSVSTSSRSTDGSPDWSPSRLMDKKRAASTSASALVSKPTGDADGHVAGSWTALSLSPFRRSSTSGYGDNHKTWSPGSARWSRPGVILFNNQGESSDTIDGTAAGLTGEHLNTAPNVDVAEPNS